MSALYHVAKYIIHNNPWYQIPGRFMLAMGYQCYKRLFRGIISKNLFNGKKILLFPNSPIASAFVYTACPDKQEILALRARANENTIFLDIGANIGSYGILLLDKVQAVYAFEAHPRTAQLCKMNFLLNQVDTSHVLSCALSDVTGVKYFSDLPAGSPVNAVRLESTGAISVPSMTLDQFMQEKQFPKACNFILKVDVEGFELEVLQGASDFLRDHPNTPILFEHFEGEENKAMNFLKQRGYTFKRISPNNVLAER